MPNPSIVLASLDDEKLKQSIANLVAHVKRATHTMLTDTNSTVDAMEKKLKSLGNLKIDTGGSNDGGTGRRTQQHEKLTKAVNDASEAVSKETQKLQDLQQSLSGASDREQNFISQKERAANTISKENELLQRQEQELGILKVQQQQLSDAERNGAQSAKQQEASINRLKERLTDLKIETRNAKTSLDLLKLSKNEQLSPIAYNKNKAYDELAVANKLWDIMKRLKMEWNDGSMMAGHATEPIQKLAEYFKISREEAEKMVRTLRESSVVMGKYKMSFDTRFGLYELSMEKRSMLDKNSPYYSTKSDWELRQEKASRSYEQALRREESAERDLAQATQQSTQASQQKAQIDAQVAAKEKEIADTKGRIATATKEQSEAEKNASQAAKEKANIQSQVANQEKQVAEAKKQLTTATQQHTDAETKSSRATKEKFMTLDQEQAVIQKTIDAQNKLFYARTMKIPTDQYDMQIAKLERIQSMLVRFRRGETSFSPSQVSGLEKEERTLLHLLGQVNAAQQQTTQAAQRYTEEIRKQAQAIRESKQWKEKGYYTIWTDKETNTFASVNANDRRSIEEQLLAIYKAEEGTVSQLVLLESSQNASAKERLGTEQAITQEQEKRKKYVSPTINDDVYQITRNAIARKLGIEQKDVIGADAQYDSIKRVGDALKQLQDAYTRMTNEERNSPIGKQMIRQMQELQRQSQQLRAQMSRPISLKDALSGSEKTLDDIAYKMQRLQSYMQGLDTSNKKSAQEFQRAAISANLLKEKQNQLLQKNSQLIRSNGELFASNTALGRSWNYMKNRLAFYFTVGAGTQFVKNLVEIRSQYEMNERALGILINSAERGTQIFNELSQMALVSPYTLIELSNAAKQLTAYDIAAKDVVDTTRRLADMASAVGVPMERLTYALGQIKAYGYLNSRDNRMFANAGIPLVKQLSDYYTELEGKLVSTADVYDRIKNKAVSFEDTMGVIYKMTDEGGKFFDFQEKMAGTLRVQLANLNLAWNNMLNDIGSESQGVLTAGIGALKDLFLAWKDVEKILTEVVVTFGVIKGLQMLSTVAIGKQTIKTLEYVSANKLATASEYKRALSINGLNAEQARWLILTNQSNKALITAITRMGVLDKAIVKSLATMTGFKRGLAMLLLSGKMAVSGLIKGFKTLGTAILSNWPMVLLMAGMDLFMHMNQVAENNKELNKTIADGAKEATKALNDFLTAEDKVQIRLDAQNKTLTKAQGEKAWESIREQIELSAMSAKQIIPELLDIPDINDRITKSFELAERIQKATEALQGLEDELEVSQDSWLGGAFGEGLEEDIEDYVERIKAIKDAPLFKDASWWQRLGQNTKQHQQSYLVGDLAEAKSEIEAFANDAAEVIKERLGEEGIKDKIQVGEAVERIIKETEAKYPKITRGAGKKLFEAVVSDTMGEQFKGVYDAQEQYYKLFLEQLGKDYGSKFRDVTEDIKKETFNWSEAQKDAINKTAEKIKQDLPDASQDAINQILKQLNTTEFKMRIVTEFATKDNDDVQKAFDARFYDDGTLTLSDDKREKKRAENVQKYQAFRIKAGEDTVEYEKRISDEREKQEKIAKKTQAIIDKGGDSAVLARAKEENKAANQWLANMKEVEKWGGYDFSKDKGGKGSKKDPMLDTLKQTIEIVKKLQSEYDTLTKSGASSADALGDVRKRYSRTINLLNKDLAKFGLPQLDLDMIKGRNPNDILEYFQKISDILTNKGLSTLERQKAVEVVMQEFSLKAKTYNLDMITKGLNNELGKLKDEYELAIAIDADPELGNAFADMMGINVESLPHTVKEYADQYSKYLNKFLKGKDSALQLSGDELFSLTRDDIDAFREQVEAGTFNQEWFNEILKAYENISGKRKKDLEDTEKWKNGLIEKYGNLQDKLTKIYKDSVQNQVNAVKTFGTEDQKSEIERLKLRIDVTDNPAELAEINTRIAEIVKDVTDKNPIALKLVNASANQTKADTSKTYWEDFKDSDLYAMTFEDTANLSNRAIDMMIKKLEELKDKVKESPESMKALIKAKDDLEDAKNIRDPFGGIARSLRDMAAASQEVKRAQEALWRAEVDVEDAQREVDNAKNGTPEKQAAAQKKLEDALKRRAAAQGKLTQAENKGKEAQENLKSSLQGVSNQLGNVQELFGIVSKLFRAGGDDETADAIDAISEGFSVMTTVIMGVVAAMTLLEASQPWLLAIAAALSVIVGLVSFLSNQSNEKINRQIKNSERYVKTLENAYKDLEKEIENAYGTNIVGAKQAAIENKKLQLVELERQLMLEKQRSGKNRDEDKIIELEGKVIDLRNEIEKSSKEIVNDLLGISSVKDKAMELMDAYISALRKGEDAQKAFSDSYKEMIVDMLKQIWVTKVIGPELEALVNDMNERIKKRIEKPSSDYERAKNETTRLSNLSDAEIRAQLAQQKYQKEIQEAYDAYRNAIKEWDYNFNDREGHNKVTELGNKYQEMIQGIGLITQEEVDSYRQTAKENEKKAKEALDKASVPTIEDLDLVAQEGLDLLPRLESMDETFKSMLDRYGLYDKESNLSALQQGIQGITEDTASALEAITNGISQQCYLQSDILIQIRDTVQSFDIDIQTASLSQILLQLQSSYQLQQSMLLTMENWTNPSGNAVRVELIS